MLAVCLEIEPESEQYSALLNCRMFSTVESVAALTLALSHRRGNKRVHSSLLLEEKG
jgi:hypothetical protein